MNELPFPELMVPTQYSLLTIWLLGITVGLTACTITCLPFIGSWVISKGEGSRSGLKDTFFFTLGKISAYATLGALAGLMGNIILRYLDGNIGHLAIGLVSILTGIWLIYYRNGFKKHCGLKSKQNMPPFLLGYSLSFIPCPPLATLLAACAVLGSLWQGMLHGFIFGLGAALTPLFIILPILGRLGQQLRSNQPWLKQWLTWFGGSVLMIIGSYRISLTF